MTTQTIDLTPTWGGLMPALIMALESGTATGRQMAKEELLKLGQQVDKQNETLRELALDSDALAYFAQAVIGGQNVRDAWEDASNALPLPATLERFAAPVPIAQGPEGAGHDLPACRACGYPGSDDHESCPNCQTAESLELHHAKERARVARGLLMTCLASVPAPQVSSDAARLNSSLTTDDVAESVLLALRTLDGEAT